MIYPGGMFYWNPKIPEFEHKVLETELLIFRIPKNVTIIQLDFYYQYKEVTPETKQVGKGQINIYFVPHE